MAHLTLSAAISRLHASRALLLRIRLAAARAHVELSRIQSAFVQLFALWLVLLVPVCALALLAAVAHRQTARAIKHFRIRVADLIGV